jgi:hypothetical protein
MPRIRNRGQVGEKWQRRAGAAVQDWVGGINNPREDWASATQAAASNWEQGVQRAIAGQKFERGVSEAGTQKWQRGARTKGAARYPQGITAARSDYESAMQDVFNVIESTQLPPRGPRGSAQNFERSRIMGQALNRLREGE